ncbi:Serpin_1 [Hexamita inflata]|uniref:Serpin 1 n=1 Tax=Hexamita inflata TaxID=28002 RepID=A0AA86QMC6_9EUKA|nr:Serpin 1 [Hexamita inflata]
MQTLNNHAEQIIKTIDFTTKSMCYSPFSIMHVLLLLSYCANDDAINELVSVLQIDRQSLLQLSKQLSSESSITIASNIFDKSINNINKDFLELVKKDFGIKPETLMSAAQVNSWCALHTNNKITHLIDSANFETILISAIHFKANWKTKFDVNATHEDIFNGFSTQFKKQFMNTRQRILYAKSDTFQVCKLPYADSTLSALIILPTQNTKASLTSSFAPALHLPLTSTDLILSLPKFTANSTFSLNAPLQSLKIKKIFHSINATETLGKTLKVDAVIQKTFINIDESGTEAAAVSAVFMRRTSSGAPQKVVEKMDCDRPFWFLILNEEGAVVFVTSVID